MKKYYDVLEIKEDTSIEEIKKAYRRKAKQLHPDVNSSETAEADFIQVNEAYEYLINIRLGLKFDSTKQKYSSTGSYGQEWSDSQKSDAHKRGEYYAKKRYKDFVNSKFYKDSKLIEDFASFVEVLLYFCLVVAFPFILSFFYDLPTFWISVLIAFLTVHGWGPIVAKKRFPPIRNVFSGFLLTVKSFTIKVVGTWSLFLLILFTIGFRTFITIYEIGAFVLIIFISIVIIKKTPINIKNLKELLKLFSISLLFLSFLLSINYFISFKEKEETYSYETTKVLVGKRGYKGRGSMIVLENNTYTNYPSVRFFFDYEDILGSPKITFTTREGLLIYKVYTKRVFK